MIAGFYGALAMGNLEEARKIGHFLTPADKRRIVNHIPDKGTGLLYKWVWNYDARLFTGCNGWVMQDICNCARAVNISNVNFTWKISTSARANIQIHGTATVWPW